MKSLFFYKIKINYIKKVMTQINRENFSKECPSPITIDETEIILRQMKNSICKIENNNGEGTGFFCKILNKRLLIINNNAINEEMAKNTNLIKVALNDNKIKKSIKILYYYASIKYDTTIIEIDDKDENINYLELDDEIFDLNDNINNKRAYIIQNFKYDNEAKIAVSYGLLNEIKDESNIIFFTNIGNIGQGSAGSPIIKLSNNKVIGIFKENIEKNIFNRGTLLKYPIYEYLEKINENNTIKLLVKISKEDIKKNIYFLDNTDGLYFDGEHHHDNLKELNKFNTEIFINNIKYLYNKSFKPTKKGLHEIKMKFNIKIKDCSYMFCGCTNITNIDLSSFDSRYVGDMSCMFSGCCNLANINLSFFESKNVTNMRNIFSGCSSLTSINLSSFDIRSVTDMNFMFYNCSNLIEIDLSSFDTKNVNNTNGMFFNCPKLNIVKVNNNSSKIIEELINKNINIIDQFGNKISKDNYINMNNNLNNNPNNFFKIINNIINFNNNINDNRTDNMSNNMMDNMNSKMTENMYSSNMMNSVNNNMVNSMNNNTMK